MGVVFVGQGGHAQAFIIVASTGYLSFARSLKRMESENNPSTATVTFIALAAHIYLRNEIKQLSAIHAVLFSLTLAIINRPKK